MISRFDGGSAGMPVAAVRCRHPHTAIVARTATSNRGERAMCFTLQTEPLRPALLKLFDRHVIEVVPEVPRSEDLDAPRGPPHGMRRNRDHRHLAALRISAQAHTANRVARF